MVSGGNPSGFVMPRQSKKILYICMKCNHSLLKEKLILPKNKVKCPKCGSRMRMTMVQW